MKALGLLLGFVLSLLPLPLQAAGEKPANDEPLARYYLQPPAGAELASEKLFTPPPLSITAEDHVLLQGVASANMPVTVNGRVVTRVRDSEKFFIKYTLDHIGFHELLIGLPGSPLLWRGVLRTPRLLPAPTDDFPAQDAVILLALAYDPVVPSTFDLRHELTRAEAVEQVVLNAWLEEMPLTENLKLTDVPVTHSVYADVCFLMRQGVIAPTETFKPQSVMSLAQGITLLYRLAGAPAVDAEKSPSTLASDEFFKAAWAWGLSQQRLSASDRPVDRLTQEKWLRWILKDTWHGEVAGSAKMFQYAPAVAPQFEALKQQLQEHDIAVAELAAPKPLAKLAPSAVSKTPESASVPRPAAAAPAPLPLQIPPAPKDRVLQVELVAPLDRNPVYGFSHILVLRVQYEQQGWVTLNQKLNLDLGKNTIKLGGFDKPLEPLRLVCLKQYSDVGILKPEEQKKVEWLSGIGVFDDVPHGDPLYLTRRMVKESVLRELRRISTWRSQIDEGKLDGIFYHQSNVTREQLLKGLVTLEGIDIVPFHKLRPDWNPFADISIIHPSFPVAAAAYQAKILTVSRVRPDDVVTRADFLDFLWNCPSVMAKVDALQDWEQGF